MKSWCEITNICQFNGRTTNSDGVPPWGERVTLEPDPLYKVKDFTGNAITQQERQGGDEGVGKLLKADRWESQHGIQVGQSQGRVLHHAGNCCVGEREIPHIHLSLCQLISQMQQMSETSILKDPLSALQHFLNPSVKNRNRKFSFYHQTTADWNALPQKAATAPSLDGDLHLISPAPPPPPPINPFTAMMPLEKDQ